MVVIVHFLHYGVSRPSILFVGLFLLAPLLASSHIFPKCFSHLVSCLGEIVGCAVMVQSAGSPMSPEVSLQFSILGFLYSSVLFVASVFFLYGIVVPTNAWKAPKFPLLLELGSEIM